MRWGKPPRKKAYPQTEDRIRAHEEAVGPTECEILVEMYELIWRWSADHDGAAFRKVRGFGIPHTVVVLKGQPYAWYFTSKQGRILRKKIGNLTWSKIVDQFCESKDVIQDIAASWMPMRSPFEEDRSTSRRVHFMSGTFSKCNTLVRGLVHLFCIKSFSFRII